jgi:hypothetical protein
MPVFVELRAETLRRFSGLSGIAGSGEAGEALLEEPGRALMGAL